MDTIPRGGVIQEGADIFIIPIGKPLEWAINGVEQSVHFHVALILVSRTCRAISTHGGKPSNNFRITHRESSRLHWASP